MSAHSWGRSPGSVDPRCRCPSEQQSVVVAGVRRTQVGADLQLVPSHPLLSHPDSLPGAAQHLTPRARRPVVENPLRDQASRRRQGWRLGRHCSCTSLLHSIQQGPHLPKENGFPVQATSSCGSGSGEPDSMQVLRDVPGAAGTLTDGPSASAPLPGGEG